MVKIYQWEYCLFLVSNIFLEVPLSSHSKNPFYIILPSFPHSAIHEDWVLPMPSLCLGLQEWIPNNDFDLDDDLRVRGFNWALCELHHLLVALNLLCCVHELFAWRRSNHHCGIWMREKGGTRERMEYKDR